MRLIEKEMNAAIKYGRDWSKDNTRVVVDPDYREFTDVYLHGHRIATVITRDGVLPPQTRVDVDTLRAWPTRTTLSRLRALGVDVCTRKGEVMLNGEAI